MIPLSILLEKVTRYVNLPIDFPDYPEGFRENPEPYAEHQLRAIRMQFERTGYVPITTVLFGNKLPGAGSKNLTMATSAKDDSEEAKRCLLLMTQSLAKQVDGWATLFVSEVWMALSEAENIDKVQEWKRKHGTIENFPGRKEALYVCLEHPKLRAIWTADITEEDGKRKLGAFENHPYKKMEGRFTNILLDKSAN